MTPQTKHYLIVGGGLVVAVAVGIVLYKRYEAGASASQGAQSQQSQDALAYLEASSLNSPYGGGALTGSSISLAPAQPQQSLAEEIASLEQAFGFAAPPSSSTGSSPSSGPPSSPTPPASGSPSTGTSPRVPPLPGPAQRRAALLLDNSAPVMSLEHEAFL